MSLYYTHYEQHEYIGIYTHLIVFATLLSLLTLRVHTCIYTAHTHILHSIYYYVHTLYYVYNYTQESLYIIPTCIITYLMIYTTLYLSIHYALFISAHTALFHIYTHVYIHTVYRILYSKNISTAVGTSLHIIRTCMNAYLMVYTTLYLYTSYAPFISATYSTFLYTHTCMYTYYI